MVFSTEHRVSEHFMTVHVDMNEVVWNPGFGPLTEDDGKERVEPTRSSGRTNKGRSNKYTDFYTVESEDSES